MISHVLARMEDIHNGDSTKWKELRCIIMWWLVLMVARCRRLGPLGSASGIERQENAGTTTVGVLQATRLKS